ncbi:MAG: hypothetical protein LQ338_005328 [Usnochroma carphineum]|nr:MAG: hypothetical protein LQ338_005328 [Usnochroma carphineum]
MDKPSEGWFALFCVAQIPLKKINDVLIQASDGAAISFLPKPWWFWLATENFEEAQRPTKLPDGSDRHATEAPVEEYRSPYLGLDPGTLAKKLGDASDDAWLDRIYFAVMDDRTGDDGSLLLCHVEDDGSVDSVRARPKHSSTYFRGFQVGNGSWGELKHSWESRKEQNGTDVIE